MPEHDSLSFSDQKFLFLSDAHLGGFSGKKNGEIEKQLIHLIDYCEREQYQIVILGDLFDYWMEYPTRVPDMGQNLLERFRQYNQTIRGNTLYITGNHDNWTRGHLQQQGFHVEPETQTWLLDDCNLLLLHGDGVNDSYFNLPRSGLDRLLRHPTFINAYQTLLPPVTGLFLMKYFSRFMRYFEESGADASTLNQWAESMLYSSNIHMIICGHDHHPRIHIFDFGTFINLGTFYKHQTVAIYNNKDFSLVIWDEKLQELKPFYPDTIKIKQ